MRRAPRPAPPGSTSTFGSTTRSSRRPSELVERFDLGITISCLAMACREPDMFDQALGHLVAIDSPGRPLLFSRADSSLAPAAADPANERRASGSRAREAHGLTLDRSRPHGVRALVGSCSLSATGPTSVVEPLFRRGEQLLDALPPRSIPSPTTSGSSSAASARRPPWLADLAVARSRARASRRRRSRRRVSRLETLELTARLTGRPALLFSLAFWVTPFPPLIDYPQHVAVGALLRRMADPVGARARALRRRTSSPTTAAFTSLIAALSFVVRPETAGSLLISVYPLAVRLRRARARARRRRDRAGTRFLRAAHHLQLRGGMGFRQLLPQRALRAHHVHAAGCAAHRGEHGHALEGDGGELLPRVHARARDALPLRDDRRGRARFDSPSRLHASGRAPRRLVKLPLAVWPAVVWSLDRLRPQPLLAPRQLGRVGRRPRRSALVQAPARHRLRGRKFQRSLRPVPAGTSRSALLIVLWQWPREKTERRRRS